MLSTRKGSWPPRCAERSAGVAAQAGRIRAELLPRPARELARGGADRCPPGAHARMIFFVLSGYWRMHLKYVPYCARARRHRPDT